MRSEELREKPLRGFIDRIAARGMTWSGIPSGVLVNVPDPSFHAADFHADYNSNSREWQVQSRMGTNLRKRNNCRFGGFGIVIRIII